MTHVVGMHGGACAQDLLSCRRAAHTALSETLLEQKVVMGDELASLVERYPASDEATPMPEDIVRQLVRVGVV